MFNHRAWLMTSCRSCGRRFSTGIRLETAMRYGSRGWNVKCPRCGAMQPGETRSGAPFPDGARKQLAI